MDSEVLRSVLNGNVELKNALSAAMNRKLAEKVAQAGVLTDTIGDTLAPGAIAASAPVVGIKVSGRKLRSAPKLATPLKMAANAKA